MNIQIFGRAKCADTRKAERYFKECSVKYQYVDIMKYGLSRGEYESVKRAVGHFRALIDERSRDYERLFIPYLAHESDVEEKLLGNTGLWKTPIVRNGKLATVGYCPDVWKTWN